MARKILQNLATELLHHLLELFLEDFDHLIASLRAHCTNSVHWRPAQKGKFSPTGHGDGYVGARADTSVHHDFGAAFELFCERGGGFNGRLALVELAAAVVGDDQSIRTEGKGEFGVLGVDDSFNHQVALPLVADGSDTGGGQTTVEGFVHEEAEVFHGESGRNIRLESGKLGDACEKLRK